MIGEEIEDLVLILSRELVDRERPSF